MYFNVRADAAFFNLNVEGFWSVQNSLILLDTTNWYLSHYFNLLYRNNKYCFVVQIILQFTAHCCSSSYSIYL